MHRRARGEFDRDQGAGRRGADVPRVRGRTPPASAADRAPASPWASPRGGRGPATRPDAGFEPDQIPPRPLCHAATRRRPTGRGPSAEHRP